MLEEQRETYSSYRPGFMQAPGCRAERAFPAFKLFCTVVLFLIGAFDANAMLTSHFDYTIPTLRSSSKSSFSYASKSHCIYAEARRKLNSCICAYPIAPGALINSAFFLHFVCSNSVEENGKRNSSSARTWITQV